MAKHPATVSVLMLLTCCAAQAHRPIFSDRAATDPNTAVLISEPSISQVIYREITDDARQVWLAFDTEERFGLYIQIGVPALERLKGFRPAMVVVGPGLPEAALPFGLPAGAGARCFPTDDVKTPRFFHEHFTGTDSWILRSDTVKLPQSGRYYLVAYVPSGQKGKLWLSVGTREVFGLAEWAQFGQWKKEIRKFHEVYEEPAGVRVPLLSSVADLFRPRGGSGSTAARTERNQPAGIRALGGGFVQGEVVSYSYVPNWHWTPEEAQGILPYLCEYELMSWAGGRPLEAFHEENVRRIDIAGQWSTAIMFYARRLEYRDEIIRLMLRAYGHRQLFILRDYWQPGDKHEAFDKTTDILETLWASRDEVLVGPEGDRATGRQLINNILMVKSGDENFHGLGTKGLETIYRTFQERVQDREMDGERPFAHIKSWYNMVGWAAWDYNGGWASSERDFERGRQKLPSNTQCIGVDTYDYWWLGIPYDPVDPANREKVLERVDEWHRIRTQYYPEGVETRVCKDAKDPTTWTAECWSDTHALLNGIRLAKADRAMMIYIGLSSSLEGHHTTPIETMDRYFDNCKAGPWVGLIWWTSMGRLHPKENPLGTFGYVDRTLIHYTPEHPEGVPYSSEELDRWRDGFVASRMRMWRDVVYGQFGYLNGPAPQ